MDLITFLNIKSNHIVNNKIMGLSEIYEKLNKKLFPPSLKVQPHVSPFNSELLSKIRIFIALYLTGIMIWRFSQLNSALDEIIYLTSVGFCFTWLYFFVTVQHKLFQKWIHQSFVYYILVLYEIVASLQLPITILYWGFVYEPGLPTDQFIMSLNVHMLPLILVFVQLILNSYEFTLPHTLFLMIIGLIYLVINYTYSVNVAPIYEVLDWKTFFSVVLAFGAFLLSFLMFIFCRFVYLKFKKNKLSKKSEQFLIQENIQESS